MTVRIPGPKCPECDERYLPHTATVCPNCGCRLPPPKRKRKWREFKADPAPLTLKGK